jgi:hypothetical protein
MGFWGPNAFDSDEALEWMGQVEDEEDTGLVDEAIEAVAGASEKDRLDIETCVAAIVSAELVAAMGGKASPRLPDGMKEWVLSQDEPDAELVAQAVKAVERISKASRLADEFGADPEGLEDWRFALGGLVKRLQNAKTAAAD